MMSFSWFLKDVCEIPTGKIIIMRVGSHCI